MSTLNQFLGIGTSLNIDNVIICYSKIFDTTAPLGTRPRGGGGFLICKASSTAWILAPRCAEVSRTWYCRNDASTLAQSCTSCTGWFVPTCAQIINPGYCCRQYWDNVAVSGSYWTSTEVNATNATRFRFNNFTYSVSKTTIYCVRSFRCVTY
jgi:hypothetical protein